MTAELWQFAAFIGVVIVAVTLWLGIIYFPARTMEYSEARRARAGEQDHGPPGNRG